MVRRDEFLPRIGQSIIIYLDDGSACFGSYKRVFTFKGRKARFCHRGYKLKQESVIGWNRIPLASETLGGTGHKNHDLYPEDITCGWKNEMHEGNIYKKVVFQGEMHYNVVSFTDSEFFAMFEVMKKHFISEKDSDLS